ncbi:Hypothetical predicted protein, partial [Olea europaea subsp. europaea]
CKGYGIVGVGGGGFGSGGEILVFVGVVVRYGGAVDLSRIQAVMVTVGAICSWWHVRWCCWFGMVMTMLQNGDGDGSGGIVFVG